MFSTHISFDLERSILQHIKYDGGSFCKWAPLWLNWTDVSLRSSNSFTYTSCILKIYKHGYANVWDAAGMSHRTFMHIYVVSCVTVNFGWSFDSIPQYVMLCRRQRKSWDEILSRQEDGFSATISSVWSFSTHSLMLYVSENDFLASCMYVCHTHNYVPVTDKYVSVRTGRCSDFTHSRVKKSIEQSLQTWDHPNTDRNFSAASSTLFSKTQGSLLSKGMLVFPLSDKWSALICHDFEVIPISKMIRGRYVYHK